MFDRIFDMRKPCISNHKLSRAHKLRLISLVQYEGTTPSLPLTVVTRMHTCTRSESRAIPSPHHLSWLALDTYKALFRNEEVRYTYIALFPGSSMFVAWPAVLQAVEGTRLRCTYVVTLLPVLHWMWIKEQQKKTGEAWERVCIQWVECNYVCFITLRHTQDRLPGYVEKLVEFRLLLYTTHGLTSFSAHVAVSVCSLERERERERAALCEQNYHINTT